MSEPIISVVIPCYNHGQYIDEAIQSVEEYKEKDYEEKTNGRQLT